MLVNSNPATIMTDPETADRTYVGPMTPELVEQIIEKERPDAILPTMGGQTALNLAKALSEGGILDKYNVELIGGCLKSTDLCPHALTLDVLFRLAFLLSRCLTRASAVFRSFFHQVPSWSRSIKPRTVSCLQTPWSA